jgi:hypothetical protein
MKNVALNLKPLFLILMGQEATLNRWRYEPDALISARPGPCGGYHAQWYPYRDLIDRIVSAMACCQQLGWLAVSLKFFHFVIPT